MALLSGRTANMAWWAGYTFVGLLLQVHFPGVDALVPGLILSLQEERPRQTAWLFFLFLLIQEGTGSLVFGSAVLWYCGLFVLFAFGKIFFVTGSLFFTVILAATLGVFHVALMHTLGSLQGFSLSPYLLAEQAVTQALLIPPLYAAASLARKRLLTYEYGI